MEQIYCKGGIPKSKGFKIIEIPFESVVERTKRCYYCRNYFPATGDYFAGNAKTFDGLTDECKSCGLIKRSIAKRKVKYGQQTDST